jgi:hypothetical protein
MPLTINIKYVSTGIIKNYKLLKNFIFSYETYGNINFDDFKIMVGNYLDIKDKIKDDELKEIFDIFIKLYIFFKRSILNEDNENYDIKLKLILENKYTNDLLRIYEKDEILSMINYLQQFYNKYIIIIFRERYLKEYISKDKDNKLIFLREISKKISEEFKLANNINKIYDILYDFNNNISKFYHKNFTKLNSLLYKIEDFLNKILNDFDNLLEELLNLFKQEYQLNDDDDINDDDIKDMFIEILNSKKTFISAGINYLKTTIEVYPTKSNEEILKIFLEEYDLNEYLNEEQILKFIEHIRTTSGGSISKYHKLIKDIEEFLNKYKNRNNHKLKQILKILKQS